MSIGSRTCPVKSPWIIPLFPSPLSLDYFTKNIPSNETRSYLYLRLNEETAEERDLTIELFHSFFFLFNRRRDIAIYRRKLQQNENPVNWRALDSRFREISYKLLEKAESERQRSGRKQACTSTSGLCCFLRPGRYILKKIIKDFSLGELGLYSCGEVRTGGGIGIIISLLQLYPFRENNPVNYRRAIVRIENKIYQGSGLDFFLSFFFINYTRRKLFEF